ncbi:MAG: glycosyltransferase family 39 protein [Bacteroidota bacterium]
MRKDISPYWILLAWLLLNLVQAAFSPLDADETYYWMYARQLAWGYYDHPPAVALLINLGKDWLPGAIGLRFGHVLASTATISACWYLLGRPRGKLLWLAAALLFAQPFLHVYGFIATPDGPLLFFTVLYLLAYRRFLEAPSLAQGAVWGLTMAGLLYSKYHGVMLIFFTVLPHLGWLLRQPGAWVAALGGAALYVPHLYWQYANDFPSFRYHLSGRDDAYELEFTLGYLANQLVIFSPLLLWHYWQTFRKDKRQDRFGVACRWLVIGFLVFFLYTTTKGRTEAQWTALLSIPLVFLTFRAARDRFAEWRPKLLLLGGITVGILLLARLLLLAPREWLPFAKPFDHEPWTERLAAEARGKPVVVQNSYRLASLYEFYSGQPAWTFTAVDYRRNQYDLWRGDSVFHGREVVVLGQNNWSRPGVRPFRTHGRDMQLGEVTDFPVAKSVMLTPELFGQTTFRNGADYRLRLTAELPITAGIASLRLDGELPLHPFVIFHLPDEGLVYWKLASTSVQEIKAGTPVVLFEGSFSTWTRLQPGEAKVEFGLGYDGMPPLRGQSGYTVVSVE